MKIKILVEADLSRTLDNFFADVKDTYPELVLESSNVGAEVVEAYIKHLTEDLRELDHVYGIDSLELLEAPSKEEVTASIEERILKFNGVAKD